MGGSGAATAAQTRRLGSNHSAAFGDPTEFGVLFPPCRTPTRNLHGSLRVVTRVPIAEGLRVSIADCPLSTLHLSTMDDSFQTSTTSTAKTEATLNHKFAHRKNAQTAKPPKPIGMRPLPWTKTSVPATGQSRGLSTMCAGQCCMHLQSTPKANIASHD